MCFASCSGRRERQSVSDWACRGGRWGGGVRQSHPHRTVSTGLNSWEQSRSPSFCCCCCVLLQKPHMEPHVTANTNSRIHFAGTRRAQELPLQGWQQAAIIIRRTWDTHFLHTLSLTMKQQKRKEKYIFTANPFKETALCVRLTQSGL